MSGTHHASDGDLRDEIESALREQRESWTRRLGAIRSDRRRASAPFERDLEDQAIQRENDEVLDDLDVRGRDALAAIEEALRRIEEGQFGRCARCDAPISAERLRAQPTATTCRNCA